MRVFCAGGKAETGIDPGSRLSMGHARKRPRPTWSGPATSRLDFARKQRLSW